KKEPGPRAVQKLARALNCTPEEAASGFRAAGVEPELSVPEPIRMTFPSWGVQVNVSFESAGRRQLLASIRVTQGGNPIPFNLTLSVNGTKRETTRVDDEAHKVLPPPPATFGFEFQLDDGARWSFELSPHDQSAAKPAD